MHSKRRGACAALALVVSTGFGAAARANLFTPGDLVVSTYGSSGVTTNQGAVTPITLTEFSPSGGAAVLAVTLPTSDGVWGNSNLGIVGQYGSSSEGNIQLSGDGQSLTLGGYSATAAYGGIQPSSDAANGAVYSTGTPFNKGTISLAQSTDTNVPRLVALVDSNGNTTSSTELNDVYNTNNPRSVYSASGSTFYISGQGDGNNNDQGIFYGSVGLNTVTHPSSSPTGIFNSNDTRVVTAYANNLYYSIDTSSGTHTGVWQFNGMPAASASATRIIPANNGQTGSKEVFYSPDGFFFANPTTLYVADTGLPKAGSLGDGGIQKWTYDGSQWTLQYTLTPTLSGWVAAANVASAKSGQSGFEALTGQVQGTGANAQVQLYAVSYTISNGEPDGLYAITDTLSATSGSGETFKELESAPGNGGLLFKGVAFAPVPEPGSMAVLLASAGGLLLRRGRGKRRR